jgi:diguanylate cyclase (GGDEF)-like protein
MSISEKMKKKEFLSFRRTCAYVLALVMFSLLVISMILNLYEGNTSLSTLLGVVAIAPVLSLLWLRDKGRSLMPPMFLLCGILVILGGYLVLKDGAPSGGSLFWFVTFSSLFTFCMGLRYGTILFAGFYLFLLLLFFTPMRSLMPDPVPVSSQVRLLLSMLGTFVFCWYAEYIRHKTHLALIHAMTRLEQESLTDPLTGLGNRRDFDRYLSWVMARSERNSQPFSLALIDIDHFKKINDSYGHETGDYVLQHIADQISAKMRASDRLFRWGGEEFAMILPDSTLQEAGLVAERIRLHIEGTPFSLGNDEHIYCIISIGLSSGTSESGDSPLILADEYLYEAKATGRNKVVVG